jgi:membrane-associated phospholipid phosphatase
LAQPDFPLPYGLLWQYRLLVYIQSFHSPVLDKIATLLSSLGIESFYIFVLPIIFWGVHKRNGLRLAYIFLASMFVNAWLKVVFHLVRPIGIPGIRSGYLTSATSFSMPSGHAQGPMTFFAVIARMVKRKWILVAGTILVLAIGLSRLYLGLHWPLDVLVGWVLGLIIGLIGWALAKWWTYRQMSFPARLFLAIAFPVVLYAIHHDELSSGFAAFLLSIGVGAVVEGEWLRSELDGELWKRICVIIIGIAGLIAIQWGMKWTIGSTAWVMVRDCAIGVWATVIAPWIFVLCGLYHREGTRHAD